VNRVGGTNGAVQVSYATVAGGTASNSVDYTDVSGVLNWAAGDSTPKMFSVPILANTVVQSNVTVNLALSNPTNIASALALQATAGLTISQPPISAWKLMYFGTNANDAAIAGDSADPNQDGIVNLLAYAYAFNPLVVNTNPFVGMLAGDQYQVQFPRNTSASDIAYIVQSSADLLNWNSLMTYTAASGWVTNQPGAMVAESAPSGVPPNQFVNVTVTCSTNVMANATDQYLRLAVQRNF
jgi:hypothetical protein